MKHLEADEQNEENFHNIDINSSSNLPISCCLPFDHDSSSIHHDKQPQMLKGRPGTKNKFINRIIALQPHTERDLFSEATRLTPEMRGNVEEGGQFQKQPEKLARSRQSAKMSRERKKLYMELLEDKAAHFEKELAKTKEQLESIKGEVDKMVKQNKTVSGFTASKRQTLKKLETIIERDNDQHTDEINWIIDSLRFRIGATGKERINTLNEYYRQILNISFPALHRYMLWTASEQKHLFGQESADSTDQDAWFRELEDTLTLTEQQKKNILTTREELTSHKGVLLWLINDLEKTKKQLQSKNQVLEDAVDTMRNILSPIQCAKFIMFIEKNKYRKELNICNKGSSPHDKSPWDDNEE